MWRKLDFFWCLVSSCGVGILLCVYIFLLYVCAGHRIDQTTRVYAGVARREAPRFTLTCWRLVLTWVGHCISSKVARGRKQKRKSSAALQMFSVETNTAKQLRHFKLVCVSLVGSVLASEQYATKVTALIVIVSWGYEFFCVSGVGAGWWWWASVGIKLPSVRLYFMP